MHAYKFQINDERLNFFYSFGVLLMTNSFFFSQVEWTMIKADIWRSLIISKYVYHRRIEWCGGGTVLHPPLWDFVKELTKNSIFSPYCLPPMSLAPPLTTFSVCPWCLQVLFIQCDSLFILSKVITEHLEWHFKINFQIKNMFSDDVLLCEAYTYLCIYENFKSLNAI